MTPSPEHLRRAADWLHTDGRGQSANRRAQSLAALLAEEYARGWADARERAADAVERARPHTLASENADIYIAYENGAKSVFAALRALEPEGD